MPLIKYFIILVEISALTAHQPGFRPKTSMKHKRILHGVIRVMLSFNPEGKLPSVLQQTLLWKILSALFAILIMAQSSISALVLCCSDDGHRVIMIAHHQGYRQIGQDACSQTSRTNVRSVPEKAISPERHSTTCVDIPLGNDVIALQTSSLIKSSTQLIRLTIVLPTVSIPSSVKGKMKSLSPHSGSPTPMGDATLFTLSTVVLQN